MISHWSSCANISEENQRGHRENMDRGLTMTTTTTKGHLENGGPQSYSKTSAVVRQRRRSIVVIDVEALKRKSSEDG